MTQAFHLRRDQELANAMLATNAPRVPWDVFRSTIFRPNPAEHIAIIGPTGKGKTVLLSNIIPAYHFVALFATKPQDKEMDRIIRNGQFVKLQQWRSLNPIDFPRRAIWPDTERLSTAQARVLQHNVFEDAFGKIFREGGRPKENPIGWTLAIDELWWIANYLRLDEEIKKFLFQSRSLGHNLILATQRPKDVPTAVYDQSTHLFFLRDNDDNNLKRLGEIGSVDSGLVRHIVARLERYQVLYINQVTSRMVRTRTPIPKG